MPPKEEVIVEVEEEEEEEEVDRKKLEIFLAAVVALFLLIAAIACLIIIAPKLMCSVETPQPTRETRQSLPEAMTRRTKKPTPPRILLNISYVKLNYSDASEACEKLGSKLAFPHSSFDEIEIDAEIEKLLDSEEGDIIKRSCGSNEFIIGPRKNLEREWQSPDGTTKIFGRQIYRNLYTVGTGLTAFGQCVRIHLDEPPEKLVVSPCRSRIPDGLVWTCYLCEHDCIQGECNHTVIKIPGHPYTFEQAEDTCRAKFENGMLATIYHHRQVKSVVDKVKKSLSSLSCYQLLIGNRATLLLEDIYENPLMYHTKKVVLGDKQTSELCLKLRAEKPYRWLAHSCDIPECFVCYNN